jgi:hypothetical protein
MMACGSDGLAVHHESRFDQYAAERAIIVRGIGTEEVDEIVAANVIDPAHKIACEIMRMRRRPSKRRETVR